MSASPRPAEGHLFSNLVLFGRVLRRSGLDAGPRQIGDLAEGLGHFDITRRRDFKNAARAVLVHRREHLLLFDRLFDLFWRPPQEPFRPRIDLGRSPRRSREVRRTLLGIVEKRSATAGDGEIESDEAVRHRVLAYSAGERLRHKDFAELSEEESRRVRSLVGELRLEIAPRRTHRKVVARRGLALDLRRTLRRGLRYGGEPLELAWRRRKVRPRPLVLICDISSSMEIYSRILLQFAYALGRASERFEAFVFGTRLTRITRQLAGRDPDRALREAAGAARDWGGGTRVGESLRVFNQLWGRRVLGRGAVVAVICDGCDRGDPELLRRQMERLRRTCSRLIWLNPLLGSPGYQPLTRGMRTALPLVDDFLPVHNLHSLEQLAEVLKTLGPRPARIHSAPPGPPPGEADA